MKVVPLEVFTTGGNVTIVKAAGRQFPGLLVQGDTFASWCELAQSVARCAAGTSARPELQELLDGLTESLLHYQRVLKAHGLELPFRKWKQQDFPVVDAKCHRTRYGDYEAVAYVEGLEDRAEVLASSEGLVLVVADGAGGTGGGARAAERIIEETRPCGDVLRTPAEAAHHLSVLDGILQSDRDAGESCAVVAVVRNGQVWGASGEVVPTPFGPYQVGSTILLCTDGIHRYAQREQIRTALNGLELVDVADDIVDLVRLRSGHLQDDVGLVLCRPASSRG